MGILPVLDSRPRLVLPDTPPELVSPGASSYSSSSSQSADQPWVSPALTSSSMPRHEKPMTIDMSADQSLEGGHNRPNSAGQATPRQQLPSLSSLFGPPPPVRPLHSPVSDRPASYSSTSPLDRSHAPSSERQHPNSYFSQTLSPPVSHPRTSYDTKFESSDRNPSHGVPRSFSGPESPKYREAEHARPVSRSDASAAKWPMQQQDTTRHEYSLGSGDASFRSPQDQFRLQFPGSKDRAPPSYPEQRPNPPPTPTSTVTSEGIPSKDGLGPKIWTGTHFLPRFVRAAEVPGEGLCYFYDDGSHCKTVIDGEAVNAHWGVTKAGKPRKRLAIACVTCREKKIKCDPDYPRCLQCEKFGRICKFKNAPRGGHNTSPSTPPAELDDGRKLSGPSRQNDLRVPGSNASSPVSPRTTLRQPSPEAGSHKRLRVGYDSYVPVGEPATPIIPPEPPRAEFPVQREPAELPRIAEDVLNRAWNSDPTVSDLQSIRTVLAHFFGKIDGARVLRFVPEASFQGWVTNPNQPKSPDDLMLLYGILSVGVALSGGQKGIAYEYAQVAHYAQRMATTDTLQLVQCRLLLSLYYVSISRMSDATEMLARAVTAMMALKLNVELEESPEANLKTFPFGMSKAGYRESRRRTFWSLFMLERLNGYFPDRPAMINPEDIYTRLPADSHIFERELESHSPIFNPYASNFSNSSERELGVAAHLVEMVHIWSTAVSRIYRMARRITLLDTDSELHRIKNQIQDWYRMLPSQYLFNSVNLEHCARAGEMDLYLTMHLLYNHVMIKLNRHSVAGSQSSPQTTSLYIQRSYDHSTHILNIFKAVLQSYRGGPDAFPPIAAMVLMEAVDVLTASGPLSRLGDTVEDVRMVFGVIDSMGAVWEESQGARDAIDARLEMLRLIRDRGTQAAGPVEGYRLVYGAEEHGSDHGLRWQINNPMQGLYLKELDNIYLTHR